MSDASTPAKPRRWTRILKNVFFLLLTLFMVVQLWFFAWVLVFKFSDPVSTSFMRRKALRLENLEEPKAIDYRWADYDDISTYAKQAAIASEDAGFVSHFGLDPAAMRAAWAFNAGADKPRGGSTITQQLAKNLFMSPSRSYFRKGEEALISLMLEATLSKRRILELYLNVAEFGEGIHGVESAAQHYFGTDAAHLSKEQAARLIVLLPSPRGYGPYINSKFVAKRSDRVMSNMPKVRLPD